MNKTPRVRQIGQFNGWSGTKRRISKTNPINVLSAHSCAMPQFSITMRVGELRKLITKLHDDEDIIVTVAAQQAAQFTYTR